MKMADELRRFLAFVAGKFYRFQFRVNMELKFKEARLERAATEEERDENSIRLKHTPWSVN